MLLELTRNLVKDRLGFHGVLAGVFPYVGAVKGDDPSLGGIDFLQVGRFNPLDHGLRHAADRQILPKCVRCLAMRRAHRLPGVVMR